MRFCEFISELYKHFPCSNQGQFVLEIFSALCGETNPSGANQESSNRTKEFKFSPSLPVGLVGCDATYRKRLFGSSKKYCGLSSPIKNHVQATKNKDTFIAYCDSAVSVIEFPMLCEAFNISSLTDRKLLFEAIYEQFIEFSRSQNDDVALVIPDAVARLIKNRLETTVEPNSIDISPLYPGDDILLVSELPTQRHVVGFYELFEHTWEVKNNGTVTWEGRQLECINQAATRIKALNTTIAIPKTKPGANIRLTVQINARGFEGKFESIWKMKDDIGRLCFPDESKALKVAAIVVNMRSTQSEV